MAPKTAYQRPYKTRAQRREDDKRKIDDVQDHRFLIRFVVGVVILAVVAIVFAMKGMAG